MKELRDFRLSQGKTLQEMADVLGVSASLYQKIEYDVRNTSHAFLQKLKRAYPDIDLNIFFNKHCH